MLNRYHITGDASAIMQQHNKPTKFNQHFCCTDILTAVFGSAICAENPRGAALMLRPSRISSWKYEKYMYIAKTECSKTLHQYEPILRNLQDKKNALSSNKRKNYMNFLLLFLYKQVQDFLEKKKVGLKLQRPLKTNVLDSSCNGRW